MGPRAKARRREKRKMLREIRDYEVKHEMQQRQKKEEEIYKKHFKRSELREREKALTKRLSHNIPMDLRSRLNKERKKIRQALL